MLFSLGLSSHPVRPSLVRLVIPGRFAFTLFTASGFLFLSFSFYPLNQRTNERCVCVCVRSNFVIVFLPFRCRWCIHITPSTSKEKKKKQLSDTKDPVLISSKKFRMSIIAERIYLFYFPANEKKEWGERKKQKSLMGWGTKASQRPHAVPSGNKSFNVDIISRHPTASPNQRHIYILFLLYSGLLLLYLGGTGHIQLTHAWFITRLKCALFIIPIRRRRRVCVCNIEIELGRGWMKKKSLSNKAGEDQLGLST